MYDAENVEFKFSRLRRHLKDNVVYHLETLRVYSYEEYPESKSFRKLDLKVEMEGDLLMSIGTVFHDLVAAYLTDFIPYCIVFFLSTKTSLLAACLVL